MTDQPNQMPVSTCPRTDRHGYHMWPERPDTDALCPGHPAPEDGRTTPDNPVASGDTADNPRPAAAPKTDQPAEEECCGSEPPADGTWGDCWCTLPSDHDGDCRCEPCTERHGAPGWNTDDTPDASSNTADNPAVAAPATADDGPCDVTAESGDRCVKAVGHWTPRRDDPHVFSAPDDGLRERYAAAIRAKIDGTEGCANGHRLADAVMAVRDRRLEQLAEELDARMASQRRVASERSQRAEQAGDLLRAAHDTSNRSEAERARAVQRAEQAEATIARVRAIQPYTARTHGDRSEGYRNGWNAAREAAHAALDGEEPPTEPRATPAEAAVNRVRAWIAGEPVTARNGFGDGYREALRDVLDVIDRKGADHA